MWSLQRRRSTAPYSLSRLEQPHRFHGLVYINALTLSTVLFVLAAQLLLALPNSSQPTTAAAIQPPAVTAAGAQPTTDAKPATDQLSISATVLPSPQRVLPDCSSQPYQLPSQLATQTASPGVHITQDPESLYRVYGDTTVAIENDIARCTPIATSEGHFAAVTGYALATYYRYAEAAGTCHVTSAVVSLHINQTFPEWQGSTSANSQTRIAWNNFIANLRVHEQGHITLDSTAANNLYTQLLSMTAPNCSALQTVIAGQTTAANNNLNIANNRYDDTTKHGTTQGAVL